MSPFRVFTLADIPVRISVGYLLLVAYFGYLTSPLGISFALVAVFCVTLSLLVHEFGHGLVARRFGLGPHIMLHGWGGLTFHARANRDRDDALIVAAGPAAGLLLALVVWGVRAALLAADPSIFVDRKLLWYMFEQLLFINVYWSLLNLLPLWPLDGGQLFRLGLLRISKPKRAEDITHYVGAALGVFGVIYALAVSKSPFLAIIAAMLGFENIKRIGSWAASGPIRKRNTLADELLLAATTALKDEDFREASRLAHQARDGKDLTAAQLDAIWSVLAIAATGSGDHEDAVDYAKRAPRIAPVFVSKLRSLIALGRHAEARKELGAPDAPELSDAQRRELEALVAVA